MRTLIVDDQPNVRLLLSRILRKKIGCTVSEATNGLEALDLLGRHQFDLVVLDVLMPLMDGIETLETIRRTPSLRHLPVVVLSAVRDEGKVRQLVRHGITAYLAKPLRPLDVADRIQAIMTRLSAAPGEPLPRRVDRPLGSSEQRVLAARADLRPQMISATEQVFGMMLGIEVSAVAGPHAVRPGDDLVSLRLTLERQACDLEFSFAAPRSMSERMTAQFLQAGDIVTDADVSATLSEMATIISGRLQTTLRQRGDAVTLGEPCVSRVGDENEPDECIRVCFASAAHDLRFIATLQAVPRSAVASPARASAPRTPKMNAHTPQPPPVDPDVIEMLASLQEPGEPDLVVELVTLFLRDTPDRLSEITARPLDAAQAARVAHAVKGSAGNLGATGLQDLASRLEQAGHRGEPGDVLADLAAAVHAEYGRVERHLRAVLVERAGADSAVLEH